MRRTIAVLVATLGGILAGTLNVAAGPMGSVITVETDKGCQAFVYIQDHVTGATPKMPFSGKCTSGKPVSGKGRLRMPAIAIDGTWVNGVVDGAATLSAVDESGKLLGAQKATFAMGCITAIEGQAGEMPGCKEAMAPYAKPVAAASVTTKPAVAKPAAPKPAPAKP